MSKNKKSRKGKPNAGKSKAKIDTEGHGNQWIQELKNDRFEEYYRAQKLMPSDEWPKFMQTLREPLPTTFRLAGSRETVHELDNIIRSTYIPQLSDVIFESSKMPPPAQIPWYPEGLAWQLNVPKSVIRRSPEFKRFHNFLVYETDVGNISRQEAVSMVPPLFLDVQPRHLVLDMCAAPGSKTAQLLEAMHAPSPVDGTDVSESHVPLGLLIANDSDFKRTHLLVHQSSRLPSSALMVTNLDASNYPNIAVATQPASTSSFAASPSPSIRTLKFDRILCDVPCSGDGTLRKNLGIWGHWQPMDGNGLHGLQLRILLRAMKLLKPAGRIVYSTCSLNPVENEAVVAAALKAAPEFELVDVSSQLPALIRKPGLEAWFPVVDKELTAFDSYTAFFDNWKTENNGKSQQNQIKMMETHWPPIDVASLNLIRCMRIYPHLQDMGGFFVAVLQRKDWHMPDATNPSATHGKRTASQEPESVRPDAKRVKESEANGSEHEREACMGEPEEDESPHENPSPTTSSIPPGILKENELQAVNGYIQRGKEKSSALHPSKGKEKDSDGKFKEPPYTFLKPDHPQLGQIVDRLGLLPSFPTSNVFVRNPKGGASTLSLRSMYLCNDMVKRVILANDHAKIRLVAAGTKVFTRQDVGGSTNDGVQAGIRHHFRVLDDAVSAVLPFVAPETVLPGQLSDLKVLLESYYPLIGSFGQSFQSLFGTKDNGNYLVRFQASEWNGAVLSHPLVLPLWKSNASLSLMTNKKSKSALSLRVFGQDVTVFGKQTLERQAASQGRRDAATAAKEADRRGETTVSEHGMSIDSECEHDFDPEDGDSIG